MDVGLSPVCVDVLGGQKVMPSHVQLLGGVTGECRRCTDAEPSVSSRPELRPDRDTSGKLDCQRAELALAGSVLWRLIRWLVRKLARQACTMARLTQRMGVSVSCLP